MITRLKKQKKRTWRSAALPIFLVLLAIAAIGFLAITNRKINQRKAELRQRSEALKREIQILEKKIADLQAGISRTESEDYQIEELYKQGYFEEGATPVVVLPPKEKKEEKTPEEKNSLQKFLEKLGF